MKIIKYLSVVLSFFLLVNIESAVESTNNEGYIDRLHQKCLYYADYSNDFIKKCESAAYNFEEISGSRAENTERMDLNKGLLVNHPLFCGRVNRYIGSARGKQAKRTVDCLKKFADMLLGKVPQPNKKLEYFLCLKLGEKKLLNKTPDLTKLSTLPNQEMGKGDVKLKTLDLTKLSTLPNREMGKGDVKLKTLDLTKLFECFSNEESLHPFTGFECTDVDDGDGEKIPENESELLNILGSMFKTLADDVKKDCEKVFGHSPNFNWPNWFNLDFPESSMFEAFEKKVRRYPENIEKEIDGLLQFKQSQLQRTGNEENLAKISKAIANAEKNRDILNVCAFLDLGSAWIERINFHDFGKYMRSISPKKGCF